MQTTKSAELAIMLWARLSGITEGASWLLWF